MTQRSAFESPEYVPASIALAAGTLPVRLYLPAAGRGPGLVLVQEIFGVSQYIAARARDLADLGYVVAVPELYWRIGLAATPEEGTIEEVLGAGMAAAGELGLEPAIADTAATVVWLRQRPEVTGPDIGIVGFCFGGGVAFAATAQLAPGDRPAALVSYYGSALPALVEAGSRVAVPSLHHWGSADAFIPAPAQQAVRDAVAAPNVEWHSYEGANHAFDNPNPAFHDAAASQLAWERTVTFLRKQLPVK